MQEQQIRDWARKFADGDLEIREFLNHLRTAQTASLPDASIDLARATRCGYPEVVYGPGKTISALLQIAHRLNLAGAPVLVTRLDEAQSAALLRQYPQGCYNSVARTFRLSGEATDAMADRTEADEANTGRVVVVSAGTSDLPVAEEAKETLLWMGCSVRVIPDVGVAGPHRLIDHLEVITSARAVVVVAGMEGALPSVVAGHVACPVFAVPTSVGYGASFGGIAALLGMLNSCAANVAVVNIDAGFKAGYLAGLVARQ